MVVTEVGKNQAKHGLPAAGALDGSGVDEQEVRETGALLAGIDKEPLQDGSQPAPAPQVAGLPGKFGEEVRYVDRDPLAKAVQSFAHWVG
jgi:hypothetical protein